MSNKIAERWLDPDIQLLIEAGILTPTLAINNPTYVLELVVLSNKESLVKFAKEIIKTRKEAEKEENA